MSYREVTPSYQRTTNLWKRICFPNFYITNLRTRELHILNSTCASFLRALEYVTTGVRLTSLQNKGNLDTHIKIISVINTQYYLLVNTALPTANISFSVTAIIQAKHEYEAFRGN